MVVERAATGVPVVERLPVGRDLLSRELPDATAVLGAHPDLADERAVTPTHGAAADLARPTDEWASRRSSTRC
jgi:hypothetical protein